VGRRQRGGVAEGTDGEFFRCDGERHGGRGPRELHGEVHHGWERGAAGGGAEAVGAAAAAGYDRGRGGSGGDGGSSPSNFSLVLLLLLLRDARGGMGARAAAASAERQRSARAVRRAARALHARHPYGGERGGGGAVDGRGLSLAHNRPLTSSVLNSAVLSLTTTESTTFIAAIKP
jgi:hypothetical protein